MRELEYAAARGDGWSVVEELEPRQLFSAAPLGTAAPSHPPPPAVHAPAGHKRAPRLAKHHAVGTPRHPVAARIATKRNAHPAATPVAISSASRPAHSAIRGIL